MKPLELLTNNKPPKILLYGPAGAGKTALFSQASGGYLMDFDSGMRTAALLEDTHTPLRQSVEMNTFSETDPQKPTAWVKAKKELVTILNEANRGKWPFDCLVIDSLSGMCEVIQYQIMAQCGKPLGKPEIREWGLIVSEVENALSLIRALPCMVLITAHELPIDVDGTTTMKILAPGSKLPSKIPALFDELWYAKVRRGSGGTTRYIVSGQKTSSIMARTRSGMNKDFDHTEVGLRGVLSEIGFQYGGD